MWQVAPRTLKMTCTFSETWGQLPPEAGSSGFPVGRQPVRKGVRRGMGRTAQHAHSAPAGGVARSWWAAVREVPTAEQAEYYRHLVIANGEHRVAMPPPDPAVAAPVQPVAAGG
jgi:hypothetical protein